MPKRPAADTLAAAAKGPKPPPRKNRLAMALPSDAAWRRKLQRQQELALVRQRTERRYARLKERVLREQRRQGYRGLDPISVKMEAEAAKERAAAKAAKAEAKDLHSDDDSPSSHPSDSSHTLDNTPDHTPDNTSGDTPGDTPVNPLDLHPDRQARIDEPRMPRDRTRRAPADAFAKARLLAEQKRAEAAQRRADAERRAAEREAKQAERAKRQKAMARARGTAPGFRAGPAGPPVDGRNRKLGRESGLLLDRVRKMVGK